jgi:hypothetical protein
MMRRCRHKELMDDSKEMRGYWNLKGEALFVLCCKLALEEAIDCYKKNYGMSR